MKAMPTFAHELTINAQTLQVNWNEIKGKLLSKGGSLRVDDLQVLNGNMEQLVGAIHPVQFLMGIS